MADKSYSISFGIEKGEEDNKNLKKIKQEIPVDNIDIKGYFNFININLNQTIGYLKAFFLTTFGKTYPFCKCELFVYYISSLNNNKSEYHLLSDSDDMKLNKYEYKKLYLIKVNSACNCELKNYLNYMNMKKFEVIEKLKELDIEGENKEKKNYRIKKYNDEETLKNLELNKEITKLKEKNLELQKRIEKLTKKEEIQNFNNSKIEDFYDIVIDINSIKNVNKEGWKVKFNEKGLKKYQKYNYSNKDLEQNENGSITIGVVGNNNKGKSFLLSKISKIKLLTGTSIQSKGLSFKYPELENYKGRQLILLDSAGLETPVLKKMNIENKNIENDNENNINIDNVDEEKLKEKNFNINNKEIEINLKKNQKEKYIEKNEEFEENTKDKIMTELFLQNFIIKESDILFLVVGKLTYSEQLLINKIKE